MQFKVLEWLEQRGARFFQRNFVVVVEIIQANDPITFFEAALCQMKPDEARRAGDEDGSHRRRPPVVASRRSSKSFAVLWGGRFTWVH